MKLFIDKNVLCVLIIETYVLFIPLAYNICQKNRSLTRDGSNVAYLNYAIMWNGDISVFTFHNENENAI